MSILTREKILEEIQQGRIKVEPFEKASVGPGSIDLTLGNNFRVFKRRNEVFKVENESDSKDLTEAITIEAGGSLLLKPGETVLGITVEKLTLAPSICGWIEGRTRFARIGLGVHVTAGFIQPGVSNHQVLEVTNLSPITLSLSPGLKICQIVFERCEGESVYQGYVKNQTAP